MAYQISLSRAPHRLLNPEFFIRLQHRRATERIGIIHPKKRAEPCPAEQTANGRHCGCVFAGRLVIWLRGRNYNVPRRKGLSCRVQSIREVSVTAGNQLCLVGPVEDTPCIDRIISLRIEVV